MLTIQDHDKLHDALQEACPCTVSDGRMVQPVFDKKNVTCHGCAFQGDTEYCYCMPYINWTELNQMENDNERNFTDHHTDNTMRDSGCVH